MKSISWKDNKWSTSQSLSISLKDRGLRFGDGVFETILIKNQEPYLLERHLERWKQSAKILAMDNPPNQTFLIPIIAESIKRILNQYSYGALRLNWSRGSTINRNISIHNNLKSFNHQFWLELYEIRPNLEPISVLISKTEKRNADSKLCKCKSFGYLQSIQVRNEANKNNFDDGLLLSTTGELCCGTTSNIIIKRNNQFLTPREESGCLPGIMREQGIRKGLLKEAKINPIPKENDKWLLINSLGCQSIKKVGNYQLNEYKLVKEFWENLNS
tara:strand:- start:13458 stop:14276 length:819 start_codon:yes stop_codon:yes gene_type:complete